MPTRSSRPLSSIVSTLTGGVAGVAIGEAGSVALDPTFEPVKQDAWLKKPTKILEAPQLAELVAQALQTVADVIDDVNRNGYDSDQFTALVQLALKAPGVPEAEQLYLRQAADPAGSITKTQLEHAYAKAGLEYQYWAPLTARAQTTLLSPAQLALGIIRSTVKDPGLLVVTLDTTDSNVPQYTPAALDVLAEAAAAGFNAERLRALVGSIGLPMSTQQAASGFFRGILTEGAFNQSILEGDVRPEWAPFILEQAREILTGNQYAELELRGYYDRATRLANTAKHGMSDEDSDWLYDVLGRGLGIHQMVIAKARGGVYDGPTDQIPVDELASLQRANLRPEFYNLADAAKYTYPSGFMIKAEATAGVLEPPDTTQILLEIGWSPYWAGFFAEKWAPGTATKAKVETAADLATQYEAGQLAPGDYTAALEALGYTSDAAADKKAAVDLKPVVSARTSILSKLRAGVVGGSITGDQATLELAKTTVDPSTIPLLVAAWQHEYEIEHLPPPTSPPAAA